jgi:hypothetical protein
MLFSPKQVCKCAQIHPVHCTHAMYTCDDAYMQHIVIVSNDVRQSKDLHLFVQSVVPPSHMEFWQSR